MEPWVRFFLGTPRRFLGTLGGLTAMFGLFFPEVVGAAVHNLFVALIQAILPLVQPLLVIGFALFGIKVIISGIFPKKKKK